MGFNIQEDLHCHLLLHQGDFDRIHLEDLNCSLAVPNNLNQTSSGFHIMLLPLGSTVILYLPSCLTSSPFKYFVVKIDSVKEGSVQFTHW